MQEMKGVVSQLCDQLQRLSRTEIGCGLRRHIYPTPVTLLILQLDQTAVKKNPRLQLLILTNLIIGVFGSGERDSPAAGWLRVSDYVTVLQVPRVN